MGDNWVVATLKESAYYDEYEEADCLTFYRAVFGNSSHYMRYEDNMEIPLTLSAGGADGGGTWISVKLAELPDLVWDRNDAYLSACTYFPRKCKSPDGAPRYYSTNSRDTADELCAFVLDIDRADSRVLTTLLEHVWRAGLIPSPTYLVASGTGVHLWYVLDWPVKMLKRWRAELEYMQRALGNYYTAGALSWKTIDSAGNIIDEHRDVSVELGKYDSHGLTQPYRAVGSLTKSETDTVSAWRIGPTWDVDDLAKQCMLLPQAFNEETFDMTKSLSARERERWAMAKDEAARQRLASSGKGHNPVFYPWMLAEALDRSRFADAYGSRYNVVLCLTLAARKDNTSPRQANPITRAQLESDIRELWENWEVVAARVGCPHITWTECRKAIEAGYSFRGDCIRIRWSWLGKKCEWRHTSHSKRNGRSQDEHLADARDFKFFLARRRPEVLGGRPKGSGTKEAEIKAYAAEHPDANHSQIARALGVSRPTVIKWLRDS